MIYAIIEIILNTLNGNIPISKNLKTKLKRYKNPLRNLISQKLSVNTKRKILIKNYKVVKVILSNFYSNFFSNRFDNASK